MIKLAVFVVDGESKIWDKGARSIKIEWSRKMERELASCYNKQALLEIAKAAKFHAELIQKYGDDKRYANHPFGDVYLSLMQLVNLIDH